MRGIRRRLIGALSNLCDEPAREVLDDVELRFSDQRRREICISYLDISGSPAHLRYLLQRFHQAPNTPILVGLWPAEDAILSDESLRRQAGADYYVSSLREAVKACLEAAEAKSGAR